VGTTVSNDWGNLYETELDQPLLPIGMMDGVIISGVLAGKKAGAVVFGYETAEELAACGELSRRFGIAASSRANGLCEDFEGGGQVPRYLP